MDLDLSPEVPESPVEQDLDVQDWVNGDDSSEQEELGPTVVSAADNTEVGFELQTSDGDALNEIEDPNATWDGPIESGEPISPMNVSPAPARRKKKGSGLRTGLGVVLGGLAAVPIAGGILWMLGTELPFWPFNTLDDQNKTAVTTPLANAAAKKLESQFPTMNSGEESESMMPAPENIEKVALEQIASETLETAEITAPSTGMGMPEQVTEPNDIESTENNDMGDDGSGPSVGFSGDLANPNVSDLMLPENSVSSESSSKKESREMKAPEMTAPEMAVPEMTAPEMTAPEMTAPEMTAPEMTAPKITTPDNSDNLLETPKLVAAADRASKMVEAMSSYNGPESERERRMLITYQTIAEVCEMATGDGKSIRKLADTIKSSAILDRVSTFASEWLKYSGRENNGIAIIGRPGANSSGQTLTLDDGRVVSVAESTLLPEAEKVLGLGRILDDGGSVELILTETLP